MASSSSSCSLLLPSSGVLNYPCLPPLLPFPLLLLHFLLLLRSASLHFSPLLTLLSLRLNLSPSLSAATLLALANGSPDLSLSLRFSPTALAAVLSAGAFVSSVVVGSVATCSAPFPLIPSRFIRDVGFYLLAVLGFFSIYLSGEVGVWQAVGLVGFYVFFVGVVVWMDRGEEGVVEREVEIPVVVGEKVKGGGSGSGICLIWGKVPISTLLKLTIPATSPSEWSRFYSSANIALCPIMLLYSFRAFIPLNHPMVFLIPQASFPLWKITLFISFAVAITHYIIEKDPPESEMVTVIVFAFIMSVFWISTMAGELLNCLAAIGNFLNLPPALLGLTVLAWGNSIGDLVTDVAVAKAGQPAMAMAGCFAGPMFNMLVGLGTGLVIETSKVYPDTYKLPFYNNIVVAFIFLLMSLMGSLLVVTWFRFRVTRCWGYCLVGLYGIFMVTTVVIAQF